MSKVRILAFIIFIAVALISYFSTQPVTQTARAAAAEAAIKGSIFYTGSGCQHMTGDHIKVYRWTGSGLQFLYNEVVVGPSWHYVITDQEIGQITGYYRLYPVLYDAGSTGISPQLRDSVYWEYVPYPDPPMLVNFQHFTTVTCNQEGPEQP